MAGVYALLTGLLLVVLTPGLKASCSAGRFGESCRYSCNCQSPCNQVTGSCPGSCSAGWVKGGQLCQKQNIAYMRTASSTTNTRYPNWPPQNVVDGDNDINGGPRTCFHGDPGRNHLTIDLGNSYQLYHIRFYLRNKYKERIANSSIYLDGDRSRVCYTFPPIVYNNPTDVVCDAEARYLTIENPGNDSDQENTPLNICEVEIYQCSLGTYGENCTDFCHCSRCDGTTGVCTGPGDCFAGWKGDRCDIACEPTRYGINCVKDCKSRHCAPGSSSCDRYTGRCDTGCLPGWRGTDCVHKCDPRYYGQNCSEVCTDRNCYGQSDCSHVTGTCDHGCQKGWTGSDCRQGCDDTHYGQDCLKECCSRHCHGVSSCNKTSGQCLEGCQSGWTGIDCADSSESTTTDVRTIVLSTTVGVLVVIIVILVVIIIRPIVQSTTVGVLVVIIVILAVIIIRMRRRQLSSDKTSKETNPAAPGPSSTPDHIYTDVTLSTINTTNTTDKSITSTTPAHYESFQMTEDNKYTGLKGRNEKL